MTATGKRTWKPCGGPAEAGTTRVRFCCEETGEECWRAGSWGTHGTRFHSFRVYGHGYADGDLTEKTVDESEFA